MYSKKVIENFTNPLNVGSLDNPDGVGKVGNPVCGDVMEIQIKVEKKGGKEIISDIKFRTFGCAAAIATSSMITQLAKGKTLDEAEKITKADVAEHLEGLPKIKMHCSNLASDALKEAIKNYRDKSKKPEAYSKKECSGCDKMCKKRNNP
jgi:nitrogen fixation NifU-like protein